MCDSIMCIWWCPSRRVCRVQLRGYLKGKLAIRMFERYEKLGRRYWGRHLWARGYCLSTIGLDEEKIRKYVACKSNTKTA